MHSSLQAELHTFPPECRVKAFYLPPPPVLLVVLIEPVERYCLPSLMRYDFCEVVILCE